MEAVDQSGAVKIIQAVITVTRPGGQRTWWWRWLDSGYLFKVSQKDLLRV